MATIIKCPLTNCARNRAGVCDMARLDIGGAIIIKSGPQAGLYLWCQAYAPKGAA